MLNIDDKIKGRQKKLKNKNLEETIES